MFNPYSISLILLSLLAAPLYLGVINRIKALWAGRTGQPLLQLYYDLAKLIRKEAVYSQTTSWIFRAAPLITLASLGVVLLMVPWGGIPAMLAFSGDFVLVAYLLGIGRFFTILAALDTGSSFEGMGSSREAFFSALTEPILLAVLATLVRLTDTMSLTSLYSSVSPALWNSSSAALILVIVATFVVLLTENSRIPVDDPTTHLELTMIHEVMVLDHGGPDLAFILYGASVKLWLISVLLAGLIVPVRVDNVLINGISFLAGMFVIAIAIGVIESTMARFRLLRIPQMLVGAAAIAAVGIFLTLK
jgi:formate hydrogenlyase subunit 4